MGKTIAFSSDPAQQGCNSRKFKQQFSIKYDRQKYKDMLLDASETTLGIFGFERTLYGKPKDKKWWMELRRNRMRNIAAETFR